MPRSDGPGIAVLGAGPVGLEAALYARKLGLSVTVYERGRPAEYLYRWGHVRLFSPFGMNVTPLGRATILAENPEHSFPPDNACITGREHVTAYLEPLCRTKLLRDVIRKDTSVLAVGRHGLLKGDNDARRGQQPFRLLIREGKARERVVEADVVLDCTGTYGQHRWMGDGGIPAPGEVTAEGLMSYALEDVLGDRRGQYAGKSILVVGGGYSAATTVANLAALAEQYPETWVTWIARGPSTQPIRRITNDPLRERDRLAVRANTLATRGDGNVEFHPQTIVESIETLGPDKGFKVTTSGGKARVWEFDRVISNVGYTPDRQLYRELQIQECPVTLAPLPMATALAKQASSDCLTTAATGPAALRNPEPGFFVLGAKSYGRHPHFLLRAGFEQVRDAFTLIKGKPGLDVYQSGR